MNEAPVTVIPTPSCPEAAVRRKSYSRSVAAHRGGDVGLVARRVGQRPP